MPICIQLKSKLCQLVEEWKGSRSDAIVHESVLMDAGLREETTPNPTPLRFRATERLWYSSRYSLKCHGLGHGSP